MPTQISKRREEHREKEIDSMSMMDPRQRLHNAPRLQSGHRAPLATETGRLHLSHVMMAGAFFAALAALLLYLWSLGL